MADFIACVNKAGGKMVSQEDAHRISATIMQYGGAVDIKSVVRAQFEGPSEENQILVIDFCMKSSGFQPPLAQQQLVSTQMQQQLAATQAEHRVEFTNLGAKGDEALRQRVRGSLVRHPALDRLCADKGLPRNMRVEGSSFDFHKLRDEQCGSHLSADQLALCEGRIDAAMDEVRASCSQPKTVATGG